MDEMRDFFVTLFYLLTYSETDHDGLNRFIEVSSLVLAIAMTAALLILIFSHRRLYRHKRYEDKLVFSECILVLIALLMEIFGNLLPGLSGRAAFFYQYIAPPIEELLYMAVILQWMVFVDYMLYRSRDHVRRRYRLAVFPILVVLGLDILQGLFIYVPAEESSGTLSMIFCFQLLKLLVEFGCIFFTIRLVTLHEKESRQPRFLKLSAFIIPFVIGVLFRFYDESMMALGILLTYGAVLRRDRYLDYETGFYNRAFLDFLSTYRDRNQYEGGNGILIRGEGHKEAMAKLLRELMPQDANVFYLGEDQFLVLSETLRGSAAKMAVLTIREAAESENPPFSPQVKAAKRKPEETAEGFAGRLLEELRKD